MPYNDNGTKSAAGAATSAEMFSFTINPELVNLFWGLYKGRTDNTNFNGAAVGAIDEGPSIESATIPFFIEPIVAPSANVQSQYFIFGYQLPIDAEASFTKNVVNVIRHSVITTGIVILVGLGSYCTYCSLQKLRRLFTKDSSTCSTAPVSSWWPALKCQKTIDNDILKSASNSANFVSQKTDSGNGSSGDLETLKLGLTLDLKNGTGDGQSDKKIYDGKKRNGKRRHEGENFSPSPVLTSINRGNALSKLKNMPPKEGRVLVSGGEEYTFRGDDDEFQIEYFGPARSSSSSERSDDCDGEEVYPDPYKHRSGSGHVGMTLPRTKIQAMISPSHNPATLGSQAGSVRRQLDFGDVSPIPSAAGSSGTPYLQHHHLPPLSASSSMSLSPSSPTTEGITSTVMTSTPQPPTGTG